MLNLLPTEIKKYEILPKINEISLLILRNVLLGDPLPYKFTYYQQESIIRHGLSLTIYFWEKLNKDNVCMLAELTGSLDVLKYARKNGCSVNKKTCDAAAKGGNLDLLKFVGRKGYSWSVSTCSSAAEGGHLEILKFLHENALLKEGGSACPWDKQTCTLAAKSGSLPCLVYARENKCP